MNANSEHRTHGFIAWLGVPEEVLHLASATAVSSFSRCRKIIRDPKGSLNGGGDSFSKSGEPRVAPIEVPALQLAE